MRSVLKNENETADIIKSLSKTFRQLLHWSSDLIPIEEEISFIDDFLKIQKYRFGDRFNYSIKVDDSAKALSIPKMTIQPFIENACVHGIEKSKYPGVLDINIESDDKFAHIKISDNGKGMDEVFLDNFLKDIQDEEYKGKSIGIRNVYARLKLFYKDEFSFNIESEINEGTRVILKVPLGTSI
jgi:two-component system sensor histidine kinase YesM